MYSHHGAGPYGRAELFKGRKFMKDGVMLKRIITGARAVGGFPLLLGGP
jgi:hypothetical protein